MARCRDALLGLAFLSLLAGCRSSPIGTALAQPAASAAPARPVVLAPRTTLAWTIESADSLTASLSGEADIGPDGALEVGPYGSVKVAGLRLEDAQQAIERYLAQHIPQPRVHLHLASAQPILIESTWRPAPPTPPAPEPPLDPVAPVAWADEPRPESAAETRIEEPAEAALQGHTPDHQSWQNVEPMDGGVDSRWRPVSRSAPRVMPAAVTQAQPDELPIQPRKYHPDTGMVIAAPAHGVPREHAKVTLPPYIIEPPDILLVESTQQLRDQPIRGQHLVRPDGTIGLGIYGSVYVAGMTLDQAKLAIADQVGKRVKDVDPRNIAVDVLAYNSKFYYVITDGGGYGEQVVRLPITGNETVLDAIGQINGLPAVASRKNIWVARAGSPHGGHDQILPVDWNGIAQRGATATNYQIMPGDRVYVKAQKIIRADSALAKFLSPFERVLGITLLGSTTVNQISGRGNNFNNGF